jgi:hypothetical protein
MFDFGQPQAPLPSEGMTFGEKMRKEVANYKKQKHEENLAKIIMSNPECMGEFTETLGALHDLNPSETKFRLMPDTISGTITTIGIVKEQRNTVILEDFVYEYGRYNYCIISNELYLFLKYNAKEIQEYFDLGVVADRSTIDIEKGSHKNWQAITPNIEIVI